MDKYQLHNPSDTTQAAGFARRLAASLYDWLVVVGLMMVCSVPIVALRDSAVDAGDLRYRLAMLSVATLFFTGFWTWSGQTVGMRAWRLRLVSQNDQTVGFGRSLLRFVCAGLSLLPLGMGFWWMAFDREHLSWHDRLSATRIVRLPNG